MRHVYDREPVINHNQTSCEQNNIEYLTTINEKFDDFLACLFICAYKTYEFLWKWAYCYTRNNMNFSKSHKRAIMRKPPEQLNCDRPQLHINQVLMCTARTHKFGKLSSVNLPTSTRSENFTQVNI